MFILGVSVQAKPPFVHDRDGSALTLRPVLLMNPALSGSKGAENLANRRETPCPAAAN
jgi:hypothetical protein